MLGKRVRDDMLGAEALGACVKRTKVAPLSALSVSNVSCLSSFSCDPVHAFWGVSDVVMLCLGYLDYFDVGAFSCVSVGTLGMVELLKTHSSKFLLEYLTTVSAFRQFGVRISSFESGLLSFQFTGYIIREDVDAIRSTLSCGSCGLTSGWSSSSKASTTPCANYESCMKALECHKPAVFKLLYDSIDFERMFNLDQVVLRLIETRNVPMFHWVTHAYSRWFRLCAGTAVLRQMERAALDSDVLPFVQAFFRPSEIQAHSQTLLVGRGAVNTVQWLLDSGVKLPRESVKCAMMNVRVCMVRQLIGRGLYVPTTLPALFTMYLVQSRNYSLLRLLFDLRACYLKDIVKVAVTLNAKQVLDYCMGTLAGGGKGGLSATFFGGRNVMLACELGHVQVLGVYTSHYPEAMAECVRQITRLCQTDMHVRTLRWLSQQPYVDRTSFCCDVLGRVFSRARGGKRTDDLMSKLDFLVVKMGARYDVGECFGVRGGAVLDEARVAYIATVSRADRREP